MPGITDAAFLAIIGSPSGGSNGDGGGGDTTAPTLSSPTGTQTGSTTADLGVTTDEGNGTLYSFVSTSATPPSGTDLKAGTGAVFANSQSITTTGAKTASATGLTAATAYYVHWLHSDAAGNDSAIATSAEFTTASSGGIAPDFGHGAGANLFTQPYAFDHADWIKSSVTAVANQGTAPGTGAADADLVYPTSTGSFRYIGQSKSLTNTTNYTICVDVEAAGMTIFSIQGNAPFGFKDAFYNLTTGVASNVGTGVTASMIDLGGGRWRCKYVRNCTSATAGFIAFMPTDAAGSYVSTKTGTNGVLLSNAYLGTTT